MYNASPKSPELTFFSSTRLLYCFLQPVLSLFLLPRETSTLSPTPTLSLSQGDLRSVCREFSFHISNSVSCTALLTSSGTELILQILWHGCRCHLPQDFASVKFVLIPHTFTHSTADLIIAGLHWSKLGNLRLPYFGYLIQG